MAEIKIVLTDTEGLSLEVKNDIISFELSRDINAPCDGLQLSFLSARLLGEIKDVRVSFDEELIFNGYCDTQREEAMVEGYRVFIYARSSACLLVDNDAVSYTYQSPSARSLFIINAKGFGFKFLLEDCFCQGNYTVGKGVSCYGAINNLVSAIRKKNIIVTPENELIIPDGKGTVVIDRNSVLSEKRIINRGSAISRIDYKTAAGSEYSYHFKSRSIENAGIRRTKKLNLSALPDWQRSYVLENLATEAALDYNSMELVTDKLIPVQLYDRVKTDEGCFEGINDYRIKGVYYSMSNRGVRTILKLFRQKNLEEIIYVD